MAIHHIIYHYLLGIRKFIVYNEARNLRYLFQPFIDLKIVIYIPSHFKTQIECQLKTVKLARENSINFLGLLDVDEFVVLKNHETIPFMLSKVGKNQSVVCIPWIFMNGSDSLSRELLTPLFEICPSLNCGSMSTTVKSFVRP